jgi:muconolactone delta-isomerase
MRILAIEKASLEISADQFLPFLKAEAARAWELYQAGILRELYFRADRKEAVLLMECSTLDEAESALASLPLVEAGLISFDIIPLRPYPGFNRLFVLPDGNGFDIDKSG